MEFQLAINLERVAPGIDMSMVFRHTLEMVQMAERGGFKLVWAAEHHALEMTIAPNPFQILTWLASETNKIRLGTAVAVAPYWHPINLAGEAAFLDVLSDGRLDFGIGSGAYQREFDRMKPGVKQTDGWRYMQEMLPVLKALWQGDYAHHGKYWQFPMATSVPKPLQKPYPPLWVAARAPITFDYAIKNQCNIISWPFTRPFAEVELYRKHLDQSLARANNDFKPKFAMMRHAAVYDKQADGVAAVTALRQVLGQFENLYRNLGDVKNGFPNKINLEQLEKREQYNPSMLEKNLLFGSPTTVIKKLHRYQQLGIDSFIYYASFGLDMPRQKRSLALFCDEVIPEFYKR